MSVTITSMQLTSGDIVVRGTASAEVASIRIELEGHDGPVPVSGSGGPWSHTFSKLGDYAPGSYTVKVRAFDANGNLVGSDTMTETLQSPQAEPVLNA